jgi:hypothetical protein
MSTSLSGVCVSLEQKSGLSYKLASQAGCWEMQKRFSIAPLVISVQLVHVYVTIACSFCDGISLKPLSCSVAP